MSDAMEAVFGRHKAEIRSISGVYGAAYEGDAGFDEVRRSVEAFESEQGRRPRILVAQMGQDSPDSGAKLVGTAFADPGSDGHFVPLYETPVAVARAELAAAAPS